MDHLIGQSITVYNDRGAQYRGVVQALLPNGDILMVVHAIRLVGRGGTGGSWHELKRHEVQRVTGPRDVSLLDP